MLKKILTRPYLEGHVCPDLHVACVQLLCMVYLYQMSSYDGSTGLSVQVLSSTLFCVGIKYSTQDHRFADQLFDPLTS